MPVKAIVFNKCMQLAHDKIALLEKILDELKESGMNETKSTAGDKHETALAMIQIEQENKRRQLKEALAQYERLKRIDISTKPLSVGIGSLVKINKAWFFISQPLGKITVDNETVMAISPQSPLGIKLMGLVKDDSAELNGIKYTIEIIE